MSTKKIAKIFGIIILAAIIAATLAVMVFERYIVQRSQYEIPVLSDHGIFYGDTPAEVSRKLGTKAAAKERLPYAPETYIRYNAAILVSNAEITCYFLYGRYLTEADIYIRRRARLRRTSCSLKPRHLSKKNTQSSPVSQSAKSSTRTTVLTVGHSP